MSVIVPAGSDLDRAEQHTPVYDRDRDSGLDGAALRPPAEQLRAALDTAELADRIEQAWIVPYDDDRDDTLHDDHLHDDLTR
ncbi:hypothetical protein ACIP5Y_19265 [Nocardia sp. NPDC088792]|uniref:hypothetical protein n=1 Tax=Nocardia sp. NPDC088792 TaxID=3364332 RepID=UPI0038265744